MFKRLASATICALLAVTSAAGAGEIRPGCYHRDYTDSHLRKYPDQVVDWITMLVERDVQGYLIARMMVATANQGHAGRSGLGGRIFTQWLNCYQENGTAACSVECDGGRFVVTRQTATSLTFQTRYLLVGQTDECGGALDLAEKPRTPVKYRLDLVSDSACDGL